MRKRRIVILGLALTSWLAIACTSGIGAMATIDDGNDRPTFTGRENPGAGREAPQVTGHEAPPPGREVPPTSQDNPGTFGGGPRAGGVGAGGDGGDPASNCPPCDGKLECLVGDKKQSITLKTTNGVCSAGDGVTFDCSGKIMQNGAAIGTWSGSGSSYVVSITIQGTSQTLACTRAAASTPPPPPTSTGSGGTQPPDAGGGTIVDASTKG